MTDKVKTTPRCKCGDPACDLWREDIVCPWCSAEMKRISDDPDFEGRGGDMGDGHFGDCPHGEAHTSASVPPEPPTLSEDAWLVEARRIGVRMLRVGNSDEGLIVIGLLDRVAALCDTVAALRADLSTAIQNYEIMHNSWKGLHWETDQLRAEVARQDALLRDVGSIALASWSPESGTYNIRIPDATWQAVRAYIRAALSASTEDRHG